MSLIDNLKDKIKDKHIKVVFPEGQDERIVIAACRLLSDNLVNPILLGNKDVISDIASKNGYTLSDQMKIIDPNNYSDSKFSEMVNAFLDRRKGKNTEAQAKEWLRGIDYFGTMLVYMNYADALVFGATYPTGDAIRPALQIIKTKPGIKRTSGAFIMTRENGKETYLFADCAINIDPDAETLASIATESIKTAKLFGMDPRVAMLSFSTKGSAKSPQVDKVVQATQIAQNLNPNELIDGELQFDAALIPEVGRRKAPNSKVAGKANVFIFPDLQSGNIGYKIAQRLGNFEAIGPILQGLNKPISDLSRGCSADDVYMVGIITAAQTMMDN